MNLTAEYMSIDNECQLFREISIDLKSKIERSVYNRRKLKLFRSNSSEICKEEFYSAPNRGFCASQNMHYYGCKIHAVCYIQGVFKSFDISKASVHDIHYLKDIKEPFNNCVILADKGYLSANYQLYLFESKQMKLEVPMQKNQHNYKK